MASLKEKLADLDKTNYKSSLKTSKTVDSEFLEFDSKLVENEHGKFVLREKHFPLSQLHGITLEKITNVSGETFELLSRETAANKLDVSQLLFFDTETTGLAGGSGTYAFLVGVGYILNNEIIVKQYFMKDFDAETAMLVDLLKLMDSFEAFVSFNGKSYDLPLLRNRFILNRLKQSIDSKIQIDLLHPARRFWKTIYGDTSLQGLERALLNFRRTDDIPGSMIPGKFFEYLNTKEFDPIKKIFQHNVMDILSMVALLVIFDDIIKTPQNNKFQFDKTGLLGSFLGVRWIDRLLKIALLLQSQSKTEDDFKLLLFKSMVQKKYGNKRDAANTWIDLVENYGQFDPFIHIELAKYYEHDRQDYENALKIVNRAIKRIEFKHELENAVLYLKDLEDLNHRKERIQRKRDSK